MQAVETCAETFIRKQSQGEDWNSKRFNLAT